MWYQVEGGKGEKIGTTVNSIINKTYFKKEINKKAVMTTGLNIKSSVLNLLHYVLFSA